MEKWSERPEFEWDEKKPIANLAKHGPDFRDASVLFEGQHTLDKGHSIKKEVREIATGLIDGFYVTAIFALRGPVTRIIS